jgi:hypothetical protein
MPHEERLRDEHDLQEDSLQMNHLKMLLLNPLTQSFQFQYGMYLS